MRLQNILERWLITHMFYNGLIYSTRMTIDVAADMDLMNKDIKDVSALI